MLHRDQSPKSRAPHQWPQGRARLDASPSIKLLCVLTSVTLASREAAMDCKVAMLASKSTELRPFGYPSSSTPALLLCEDEWLHLVRAHPMHFVSITVCVFLSDSGCLFHLRKRLHLQQIIHVNPGCMVAALQMVEACQQQEATRLLGCFVQEEGWSVH